MAARSAMPRDRVTAPDRPVAMEIHGSAGELPAEVATPLALVVSELVQNAVGGQVPSQGSSWQLASQPSRSTPFPSSQLSVESTTWLPP